MNQFMIRKQEEYDRWFEVMESVLSDVPKEFSQDLNLDYSVESVRRLENRLLEIQPTKLQAGDDLGAHLWDWSGRYVGEVILRHIENGEWFWQREDTFDQNKPCVRCVGGEGLCAPITFVTAAMARRTRKYAVDLVAYHIERANA